MKTVLIVMLLSGRIWEPLYVVEYPTEQACMAAAKAGTDTSWISRSKAVCVPKVALPKSP